jgi:hypothetical protein
VASSSETYIPFVSYVRGDDGEVLPEDPDEIPGSKEEGLERWKFEMTIKFLKGDDLDFDYKLVDECSDLDEVEGKDEEERWFDTEEPSFVEKDQEEQTIGGETGIQDF